MPVPAQIFWGICRVVVVYLCAISGLSIVIAAGGIFGATVAAEFVYAVSVQRGLRLPSQAIVLRAFLPALACAIIVAATGSLLIPSAMPSSVLVATLAILSVGFAGLAYLSTQRNLPWRRKNSDETIGFVSERAERA